MAERHGDRERGRGRFGAQPRRAERQEGRGREGEEGFDAAGGELGGRGRGGRYFEEEDFGRDERGEGYGAGAGWQSRGYGSEREPGGYGGFGGADESGPFGGRAFDGGQRGGAAGGRSGFGGYGERDAGQRFGGEWGRREEPWGDSRQQGHAGRGPKGYRRSDERVLEDACQALEEDPRVDASNVEVACKNGELVLKGTVSERSQKRLAETCVEGMPGVRDVRNEIRVVSGQETRGAHGEKAQSRRTGEEAE